MEKARPAESSPMRFSREAANCSHSSSAPLRSASPCNSKPSCWNVGAPQLNDPRTICSAAVHNCARKAPGVMPRALLGVAAGLGGRHPTDSNTRAHAFRQPPAGARAKANNDPGAGPPTLPCFGRGARGAPPLFVQLRPVWPNRLKCGKQVSMFLQAARHVKRPPQELDHCGVLQRKVPRTSEPFMAIVTPSAEKRARSKSPRSKAPHRCAWAEAGNSGKAGSGGNAAAHPRGVLAARLQRRQCGAYRCGGALQRPDVYHYFRGKESLYLTVLERAYDRIRAHERQLQAGVTRARQRHAPARRVHFRLPARKPRPRCHDPQ